MMYCNTVRWANRANSKHLIVPHTEQCNLKKVGVLVEVAVEPPLAAAAVVVSVAITVTTTIVITSSITITTTITFSASLLIKF